MVIHADGENTGLATAYNRAAAEARRAGCTHLMTMDQDSRFECFGEYRRLAEALFAENPKVLCFPTGHEPTGSPYRSILTGQNSGCIVSLDMLDKVGGWRDDFFISLVDAELQVRAQEHGYRLVAVEAKGLKFHHQIGSQRTVKVLGHTFRTDDYSPLRRYYDSRNRLLLARMYPYEYSRRSLRHHLYGQLSQIARVRVAEDRKWAKTCAIVRGTLNGLLNRHKPF